MTAVPLVIFGGSGLAREFHDIVESINEQAIKQGKSPNFDFLGFIDRDQTLASSLASRGPLLGGDEVIERLPKTVQFIIAIADGPVRHRLDTQLLEQGLQAATLIHPLAYVGHRENSFGPGTVVCANASVTTAVKTGRHVHIHVNATVGHDSHLHDYASLLPSSSVSGNVSLGREVMLGTGARIIQGLTVGDASTIGAGAVVTRSLPAGITAVGIPARAATK
jgi:sugar O-acyltransferase (sialic acid O-acetyltransferase NeuD family)